MTGSSIDADDLAMLTSSFAAAVATTGDGASADAALHELGWAELLGMAPAEGAATTFSVLGTAGSAASLLDDVLSEALGVPVGLGTCVILPTPHTSAAPGARTADSIHVAGLASARLAGASRILLPVAGDEVVTLFDIAPGLIVGAHALQPEVDRRALDAASPYVRIAPTTLPVSELTEIGVADWHGTVAAARVALAHQMIAACRVMLGDARQHALDREQFGRAVSSFQVIRHKLADSLAAVEAASAVADLAVVNGDVLTAAVAKSLAGKAARTTSTHAQQVLAGIGFTTEHDFHLSLKRTMVLDTLFGSAKTLPTEIGRLLLTAGRTPRLTNL
jgi:alkylation response protein AidB-like acyl-CoA dehydrogenase